MQWPRVFEQVVPPEGARRLTFATVDWPAHAEWTRSVERLELLNRILEQQNCDADDVTAAMLQPPLRATDYNSGFGTVYTAVYCPRLRAASSTAGPAQRGISRSKPSPSKNTW